MSNPFATALLHWAMSWENLFMPYANNKGTYQPAHPRDLISAFVVRCLDTIIPLVSISEISSLYLASVAAQAGLSLTWSQTPNTGFLVIVLVWWTRVYKMSRRMTKQTKWPVRPAKTQISLGIRPVWSEHSRCAQWVAKDSEVSSGGQPRLWSNWADFGFVMLWLKLLWMNNNELYATLFCYLVTKKAFQTSANWNFPLLNTYLVYRNFLIINEPRHEKTCLRGVRPGKTQTGLLSWWD